MLDRKSTIGVLITLIILALIGLSLYLGKKYCCVEEDIEICPSCPSGICIIPGQPNSFYNMDSACNNPGNDKYGGAGCDYLGGNATREPGSCTSRSSRMASLILSHSLSGCPSVTDSDVNR